jgi:hypothetical protein
MSNLLFMLLFRKRLRFYAKGGKLSKQANLIWGGFWLICNGRSSFT